MVVTLLLLYGISKLVKSVIKKQKNAKNIFNLRGGEIEFEIDDDTELALTILSCIEDNKIYLVKNKKIIKLVFNLVKAKVQKKSLVINPNLMRFLALKLINNDQILIVVIKKNIIII